MDFMPRYMRWSVSNPTWSGYVFSYHILLVIAAALGALIAFWNQRNWRHVTRLQRKLSSLRKDYTEHRSHPESEEEVRGTLRKALHVRSTLVEPVVGAFFITMAAWLSLVIIAGKLDPEWSRPFLAPPMLVAQNLQRFGSEFLPAMLRSGWHMLQGVVIGTVTGILLGFLLSNVRWLQRWTAWHVTIISALPPFLLAEIFRQLVRTPWIPIFGVKDELAFKLAVVMASWAVLWPVLTATAHALAGIDEEYRRSLRLLGARTARERIVHLELPFIAKPVLSNLRVGFVIGLIVLLYAEGYGGPRDYPTLGYWFSDITSNFKLPVLWALLLFTSLLVVIFEGAFKGIESWMVSGHRADSRSSGAVELARSVIEERSNCLELFERARMQKWPQPPLRQIPWAGINKGTAFTIYGIKKSYGGTLAFRADHQITAKIGEFISVIGRSGAGKSTFVKLLLGFEEADVSNDGCLELGGIDMLKYRNPKSCRPVEDIVSYVAQRPSLLPHWTVKKNLLFGVMQQLRYARKRCPTMDDDLLEFYIQYFGWLLGIDDPHEWEWPIEDPEKDLAFNSPLGLLVRFMGISEKMKSYPHELSGGEAQRVHLLRWLILARPILFLDEAFSALDQPLKGMVRDAIHRHAKAFGISVINISHDRGDVLQVSDRVLFVEDHKILEDASPRALFFSPRTRDLALFLGHTNLFEVEISSGDQKIALVRRDAYRKITFSSPEIFSFRHSLSIVDEEGMRSGFTVNALRPDVSGKKPYTLFIPSSDVNIVSLRDEAGGYSSSFKIESVRFTGTHYDIRLIREREDGVHLKIDSVVQDDDLAALLNQSNKGVEDLVGMWAETDFVRGIVLPGKAA